MKYGITDLAETLGITTSAIRYFEKEHLIQVEKEDNGRRLFNEVDVFRLLSYMKYRSMEIPMKQIAVQFSGTENDWKKILEREETAKENALRKAEYYQNLASAIDGHIRRIQLIDRLSGSYEFAVSPARVMAQDAQDGWMSRKRSNQRLIRQWVEKMPMVQLAVIKREEWEPDGQRKSFGFIVAKEGMGLAGLPNGLKMLELESCLCVHTVVQANENIIYHPQELFEGANRYAQGRGFLLKKQAWGNILLVEESEKEKLEIYTEIWVPIC